MKINQNILFDILMKKEISESMFKGMLSAMRDNEDMEYITDHFHVSESELISKLHEELFIPGMTSEVAWKAICFIRYEIEKGNSNTLISSIRNAILASGIYYTNVSEDIRAKLENGEMCALQ